MAKDDVISTDIDRLIKFLKDKKRAELAEVSKAVSLPLNDVEKWCRVLEEQGLVKIEYYMTKSFVIWSGEAAQPQKLSQAIISSPRKKALEDRIGKLLSAAKEINEEAPVSPPVPAQAAPPAPAPAPKLERKAEERKPVEARRPVEEKERQAPIAKPKEIIEVSEALKSKISEINSKVREVEEIKNQRETLVRDAYLPIAKRLETELEALEDRLRAKETQILRLRQKAIEIPDMVSDVELDVMKLKEKESEARKALEDSSQKIAQVVQVIRELQESVSQNVQDSRRMVSKQSSDLDEMEGAISKLGELEKEVSIRIREARDRIEQENIRIRGLDDSLGKINATESDVKKRIDDSRKRLEKDSVRIASLESEMERLKKVDSWIVDYQKEYEHKFAEFASYARENEEEFNGLREAIETGFVRKYLKELKELSESHEYEIKQVLKKETELNAKAETTKKDLSRMIQESKEISNNFEELLKKLETTKSAGDRLRRLETTREKSEKELGSSKQKTDELEEDFAVLFKKE